MRDLEKQEQFELEVLEKLNSEKLLGSLVFGGGTMLRLCFGLNRFSVGLDFRTVKEIEFGGLFKDFKKCLGGFYTITDSAEKFHTVLFELKSQNHPRRLKLEIRKETKKITTEQAIAYSRYSNAQVLLNVVSLKDMMTAKIEAFLERKEIRDVFDTEFLVKKGIVPDAPDDKLKKVLKEIRAFTQKDYTVKLGSLLETAERKYYSSENFKILELAVNEKIKYGFSAQETVS